MDNLTGSRRGRTLMCVVLASTKTSARSSTACVPYTRALVHDDVRNARRSGARSSAPTWSHEHEAEARSRRTKRKEFREHHTIRRNSLGPHNGSIAVSMILSINIRRGLVMTFRGGSWQE